MLRRILILAAASSLATAACASDSEYQEDACQIDTHLTGDIELTHEKDHLSDCAYGTGTGVTTLWRIETEDVNVAVRLGLKELEPLALGDTPAEVCVQDLDANVMYCSNCQANLTQNESFEKDDSGFRSLRVGGDVWCSQPAYWDPTFGTGGTIDTSKSLDVERLSFVVDFPEEWFD